MNLNGTEHIQREFFIRERDLKSNLLLRKKQHRLDQKNQAGIIREKYNLPFWSVHIEKYFSRSQKRLWDLGKYFSIWTTKPVNNIYFTLLWISY